MLTQDDVKKIADLAKLQLSDEELNKFTSQLEQLLEMAKMLDEVDTTNVHPIAQITGIDNMVYEDVVHDFPHPEKLLAQSPQDIQDNMIKVKSVF